MSRTALPAWNQAAINAVLAWAAALEAGASETKLNALRAAYEAAKTKG